jgi:hypothetical protein
MTSVIRFSEELQWDVANWIYLKLLEDVCLEFQANGNDLGLIAELDEDSAANISGYLNLESWSRERLDLFLKAVELCWNRVQSEEPPSLWKKALENLLDLGRRFQRRNDTL